MSRQEETVRTTHTHHRDIFSFSLSLLSMNAHTCLFAIATSSITQLDALPPLPSPLYCVQEKESKLGSVSGRSVFGSMVVVVVVVVVLLFFPLSLAHARTR